MKAELKAATRKPTSRKEPVATARDSIAGRIFGGLFGAFLGLSLLKFGNPCIMERWVVRPTNIYEFLLGYPWPMDWAFVALLLIAVLGLFTIRWRVAAPRWLLGLPLAWLAWQCVSATGTVDVELTRATLKHFAACVVCFYLGYFSLNAAQRLPWFWLGLVLGFAVVLAVGWQQHFGGLEETRRYFFLYIYPQLKEVPPGYLKKMASNRIFSTLFYPNALAGALLLFLPTTLGLIESIRERLTKPAKVFLMALFAIATLGCLYWSGSKAGWLLMLFLGLLTLVRLPINRQIKLAITGAVLLAGLAGFFWKYSSFFEKGATSVSARFDYWNAAVKTAQARPLLGSGPGTFSIPYLSIKRPESEPSKLVHNDYLEQASDSGVLGLLTYGAFIAGSLGWILRRHLRSKPLVGTAEPLSWEDWLSFAVGLGVLGWALQSLVEFGLYIPGLAWPAFALLGWLLARPASPASTKRA